MCGLMCDKSRISDQFLTKQGRRLKDYDFAGPRAQAASSLRSCSDVQTSFIATRNALFGED